DAAAPPVLEGVHLLLNDIGRLANPALKELRVFKDGRADLAEIEGPHYVAHCLLDATPDLRLAGQNVTGASRRLGLHANQILLAASRLLRTLLRRRRAFRTIGAG